MLFLDRSARHQPPDHGRPGSKLALEPSSLAVLLRPSSLQEEDRMVGNRDGWAGRESALAGVDVVNSYTATIYFEQAASLLKRGWFAESEAYLREVLRLWPDHADTLN